MIDSFYIGPWYVRVERRVNQRVSYFLTRPRSKSRSVLWHDVCVSRMLREVLWNRLAYMMPTKLIKQRIRGFIMKDGLLHVDVCLIHDGQRREVEKLLRRYVPIIERMKHEPPPRLRF